MKIGICVMYFRSTGQCVDQILLYIWKKLQDVHHEQHRGQTSQQTGELVAQKYLTIAIFLLST